MFCMSLFSVHRFSNYRMINMVIVQTLMFQPYGSVTSSFQVVEQSVICFCVSGNRTVWPELDLRTSNNTMLLICPPSDLTYDVEHCSLAAWTHKVYLFNGVEIYQLNVHCRMQVYDACLCNHCHYRTVNIKTRRPKDCIS